MLPKIETPIYEVKLISTGKTVQFRPFLVKEQKLFLMNTENDDVESTVKVIRQVLKNCVLNDIDIDSLPVFDLEYLFLNIRSKSVNEVVEVRYRCNNIVDEKTCNNLEKFDINLSEVKPTISPDHSKQIMFNDNLGMMMKYPTFEMLYEINGKTEEEIVFEILPKCIDYIFDSDKKYSIKDTPAEELNEFLDNLQQKDMEKIQKFFSTIPRLKTEVKFQCKKCKYEEDITVEGLQSFFG